jgi:uncharacterized protein YkwD
MARRIAILLLIGAALLSVAPVLTGSTPATAAPFELAASADNQCWKFKSTETDFNKKMNEERAKQGLGKLSIDPELSKAARVHTNEMITRNELYHTTSDNLRKRVTSWSVLGENVGVGSTVGSLHTAFMNSPAHRDNVLHAAYRHSGIGVRVAGGRMWVTIIFEAVTDPGTSLSMPHC